MPKPSWAAFLAAFFIVCLASTVEARPYRWCGWYMRTIFGGGPELNLARNWSRFGTPAKGPAVGTIVVWRHHVGRIVGNRHGQWIVNSGNDGNAVRTRPRSVSGAFAFRWPHKKGHYAEDNPPRWWTAARN